MDSTVLQRALAHVRAVWPDARPAFGMIMGSGWSDAAKALPITASIPYTDIPGLGAVGVVGHAGRLSRGTLQGLEYLIFQGRRHYYEGVGWTPIALPIFIMKSLGVKSVLLTNAAGGIRPDLKPGSLMILSDHINLMGAHPLLGPHDPTWGARFPDQSAVYDRALRNALHASAAEFSEPITEGVYLAGSGPCYETPAEIRAWQRLGADAVGMSTVPEAVLATAAGMRVAAVSCITNWAAGISKSPLSHEEVTETTRASMARMQQLLERFTGKVSREKI